MEEVMILKELKINTWVGDPTNCYIILDEESKEIMLLQNATKQSSSRRKE